MHFNNHKIIKRLKVPTYRKSNLNYYCGMVFKEIIYNINIYIYRCIQYSFI